MLYGNGDWYDGEWNENSRHGIGKFYYKSGDFYTG